MSAVWTAYALDAVSEFILADFRRGAVLGGTAGAAVAVYALNYFDSLPNASSGNTEKILACYWIGTCTVTGTFIGVLPCAMGFKF